MRHLPTFKYSGLTIVLDHPSRFDTKQLLTGYAGVLVNEALAPVCNRYQCDIRTADTLAEGLLPATKALLLLGENAFKSWTEGKYNDYSLGEQRGCPLETEWANVTTIASYFPQDCLDFKDYESAYWKKEAEETEHISEEEDSEEGNTKRHGKTARSNWRFWLTMDVKKITLILNSSITREPLPNYIIYPKAEEVIERLENTHDENIYLDIETDLEHNINTIGIGFSDFSIYVLPILRFTYDLGYSPLHTVRLFRSLAIALSKNTVVIHNSMFDLLILAWKYKLPIGRRIYDTMLATSRCYPEVEKSLGHCVSLWTWQPYHKDEGIFMPNNPEQEQKLWKYNGKDVYTMMLIKSAIDSYATTKPGLVDSIAEVNGSIYAYLLNTLLGMKYDEQRVNAIAAENDALGEQYFRIIELLVGHEIIPRSSKSCCKYFHEELGYKVVKRSPSGAPSLDEKALYKLKMAHPDNIIIDLIFGYRRKLNETSKFLRFIPWLGLETSPYYDKTTSNIKDETTA